MVEDTDRGWWIRDSGMHADLAAVLANSLWRTEKLYRSETGDA